jgi:hypothetical protein
MTAMANQLTSVASFLSGLYREKATLAYHGYVHDDPMARLALRAGRDNPYPVYERGPAGRSRRPGSGTG